MLTVLIPSVVIRSLTLHNLLGKEIDEMIQRRKTLAIIMAVNLSRIYLKIMT